MNTNTRTNNTFFNIIANVGSQIITLIINFITRIVFIHTFGENYLGINGLFSNILSVLSLAELGVGNAIVYCMYKPIADNDYSRLSALMSYYKKLYRTIGFVVCIIGLLIIPFLKYLVNIEVDIGNVTVYYLLYLLNTVSSYFLVYKTSILIADQKNYIIRICHTVTVIAQFAVLSFIALVIKNFYVYLTFQIIFLILNNAVCSYIAQKKYPFINLNNELDMNEKKAIWSNILSMFSYQIGGVLLNNTTNILISVLVNTVAVGFYSNYIMIIASINLFIQLVFGSTQASIGNLAVTDNENKQYSIFNILQLMAFWITSFSSICFLVLFQDFITILFTDHYLLSYDIVVACVINFYILNILQPIYCYRNTVGLFKQTRWIMLLTSIVNLVLSILFGTRYGILGIVISSGISRLLTNFWYEPVKLFKTYFKMSSRKYFINQIIFAIITVAVAVCTIFVSNKLDVLNIYIRFLLKIIICVIVPNLIICVIFRKDESFIYLKRIILSKLIKTE